MAEQIEVYHGKTADFEANAGGELTVPLCELRESYVVEAVSYPHLDVYKRQEPGLKARRI